MQTTLDTNVLIRFFTKDIPEKALKAKRLLEEGEDLYIPDVVFPEIEYVLKSKYGVSREKIIEKFEFLVSQGNITVSPQAIHAAIIYAKSKLDMADCVIAAYSRKGSLASFDEELLEIKGVRPYWK